MPPLSMKRRPESNYHLAEGKAWLSQATGGANTTAIAYAAFEFRLQIERIGFQHWYVLAPDIAEEDFADLHSFKNIENRIYQLTGNQRVINKRYEYGQILSEMLGLENDIAPPVLGRLSRCWHKCSDYCHIAWSLVSDNPEIAKNAYESLVEISQFIDEQTSALNMILSLPVLGEIEKKFIDEEITSEQLRNHLKEVGLWAKMEYDDDRPSHFVGKAVPPNSE